MKQQYSPKLQQVLLDVQRQFAYDTLRLENYALGELAEVLLDFAEDVRANIGLWAAYERYNVDFFGTPLPFMGEAPMSEPIQGIHPARVRHLLWITYPEFLEGALLSPAHRDMTRVADAAATFLSEIPESAWERSEWKSYLQTSNRYGWEVKRKLVRVGCQSYMFRLPFGHYRAEHGREGSEIEVTDDFICQECTRWSGLGVIDILAGVLDISEDDRKDLRSWYERHASFYEVLAVGRDAMRVLNVITDQPYQIRTGGRVPFKRRQMLFGSLVPWRGDWYWSGAQRSWDDARRMNVEELRADMKRRSSQIVCRFSKEYEAQVRSLAATYHDRMMAYFGKDLIRYPDGLTMAADWQKEMEYLWGLASKETVDDMVKEHGLVNRRPSMNLHKELLEDNSGLGVFINPDEGKEIFPNFDLLSGALQRKGRDLTDEEASCIRGFFESPAISPRFVRRMIQEHGDESIKTTFLLGNQPPAYWLDFVLRTHKGMYYRKRYPSLSAV